jgi:hypothetical protein
MKIYVEVQFHTGAVKPLTDQREVRVQAKVRDIETI